MRKKGHLEYWEGKGQIHRSADKGEGCKIVSKVAFCLMVSWTSEKPGSVFWQGLLRQEEKRQTKI